MKKVSINFVLTIPILLILLFLQSCTDGKSASNEIPRGSDPIPVKVMDLEKSSAASVITASGRLTTEDESLLAFKTGGVVSAVLVKEGDRVKKGQLLATLDLTEIDATVAQAMLSHEKEIRDVKRVTNLYADSVATLEQLQNAKTGLAISKEKLDAATFNRSYSEIHAPANGYVLKKFVTAGSVVSIGDPILLTNAAVQGKWILKVGVSDKEWAAIKIKDSATVIIDAFPGRILAASVCRKAETADPSTGAFQVELLIKNNEIKLATGMFGSATLRSGKPVTTWNVPFEAVLDANSREGFVFVTTDNKVARKIPVEIESFDDKLMHISHGLEEGGALIISGSAYLDNQSPIRIIK